MTRLFGLVFSTVAVFTAPAWAIESKDFIAQAIQGNLAEITAGQLAEQKGSSDAVKRFGATLIADHTKANAKAMTVAHGLGAMAPTEPNDDQKAMRDDLAGKSGAAFDSAFLAGMVADHKKDASDYQDAIDHNKDAAGQYAAETLPAIKQHLATAESLNRDASASALPSTGMSMTAASGANSFTEGEAKARIEKAGFLGVGALTKDDNGVWRGMATKNGQSMPVALDFKGDVSTK